MAKHIMKGCTYWILVLSMSPLAILLLIFMALGSLLRFLFKASLLFIIVAINTPFVVMSNVSIMVFDYYFRKHSAKLGVCFQKNNDDPHWNWSDPRASVGLEIQSLVSDFLKTVAGELLLVVSAGIITFFTAPLYVFYISMAVSLVAILHKWLNTDCLSKTALACLCDGYGLNPMMFLYSFVGLFNIGCHPVAKCSFTASRAFLFVEDGSNVLFIEEDGHNQIHDENLGEVPVSVRMAPYRKLFFVDETGKSTLHGTGAGTEWSAANGPPGSPPKLPCMAPYQKYAPKFKMAPHQEYAPNRDKPSVGSKMIIDKATGKSTKGRDNPSISPKAGHYRFNGAAIPVTTDSKGSSVATRPVTTDPEANGAASSVTPASEVTLPIDFNQWNAFERGFFRLSPRIDFIKRDNGKCILKTFMVLKLCRLFQLKGFKCEYPVERLELPEDYSKANELYHFLVTLADNDGFATDKMRGRYEHSLSLLQITEEVEKNVGYKIVDPMDKTFVVA